MKNPNTPIRAAWVTGLKTATGLGVWGKKIPKTITPIPKRYILITTQSKQPNVVSKQCWEWICQITIDVTLVNDQGFSDTAALDTIEEHVLNIANSIQIAGFNVKRTTLISQTSLDSESPTQSIERTVLIYEHWLNRAS